MWFLTNPMHRDELFIKLLESMKTKKHFYISNDMSIDFPNSALIPCEDLVHKFYERFISCKYIRVGARHTQVIAPHVAIEYEDQYGLIRYYVGPQGKMSRVEQFLKDLPMIGAMFFFENLNCQRVYLPLDIGKRECDVPIFQDSQGRFFLDRLKC